MLVAAGDYVAEQLTCVGGHCLFQKYVLVDEDVGQTQLLPQLQSMMYSPEPMVSCIKTTLKSSRTTSFEPEDDSRIQSTSTDGPRIESTSTYGPRIESTTYDVQEEEVKKPKEEEENKMK